VANAVADGGTRNDRTLFCSWYAFLVLQDAPAGEYLFYDGHCGLCHGAVKFVLKHDRSGEAFRFAPLQGPTFEARVPLERRAGLPDSIVVLTCDRALLVRSSAFLHILRRLGGGWAVLASVLGVIPRGLLDLAYNFIARIRYGVFGRSDEVCPLVPAELRARFDP
jgi:predicted DCC family thiol-disulfide oxidoreductase YuxK